MSSSRIVGQLRVECTGFTNRFWCDRLAIGPVGRSGQHYPLFAFSVLGPQIQIKALAAMLGSNNIKVAFEALEIPLRMGDRTIDPYRTKLFDPGDGFRLHRIKHPQNQAQLVALSRSPQFLLSMTEESLWKELSGPRFTTPLLRSWMPALTQELKDREMLRPLATFHADCGQLALEQEELDEIVSYLVTNGRVSIE